ncbi:Rieske (2Fe-2S) protein [Streptomyces sp. NPDC004610]|uniref:Rieske (2Fe-2S) protein n=1 Tax=unclassified Streptomyces TaxID=2593676 RepID=UPI0033BD3EB9
MASESLHRTAPPLRPARRTVMAAAGATGLAVALTACGSGDDSGSSSGSATEDAASPGGSAPAESGGGGGTPLARTSDIPEGGGKVFADQGVVVTQPVAGEFKAFSSKCTHQGCAVKDVTDGVIVCPCHQSHFSATDGSVQQGPATQPLPETRISVEGDEILLA